MWSRGGRRETPRQRHTFDEPPLDPRRLTRQVDLCQQAGSQSAESLSLKFSGDQLTERCARIAAPRPFCAVDCTDKPMEQLSERSFIDQTRAARKSSSNP